MGEEGLDASIPPFYSDEIFQRIREARDQGYAVETMKTKEWYHFLLDQEYQEDLNNGDHLCRAEKKKPKLGLGDNLEKYKTPKPHKRIYLICLQTGPQPSA